jgi:hypothetical protein
VPRAFLIAAGALTLGACTNSAKPAASPPAPEADLCGAGRFKQYVGQFYSAETGARILAAAGQVRTIRPGDAVTMDFRPDRLNLEIGEDGRITRFRCG